MSSNAAQNTLPKVLITRSDIPQSAIELLKSHCSLEIWPASSPIPRGELLKKVNGTNGLYILLTDKINEELLNAAGPSLKVIGTMSVGYDHIDLDECRKRNVRVGNTPDVLTDATAELTIALLLATSRRLMEATQQITNGGWSKSVWGPLWMCGSTLSGSTIGIIGLGRIGFGVAQRLKSFKPGKIIYSGHSAKPYAAEIGAEFVAFEEVLKHSDFIVCCCSLNESTMGLFNKDSFIKMKKNAIFINTSRGKLVNHDDLYEALTNGIIKAAGLDVMDPEPIPVDHKLTTLPNCVLLPHIGSATIESRTNMAMLTANNILAGLAEKPLPCPLWT